MRPSLRRIAATALALGLLLTVGAEGLSGTQAEAAKRVVRVPASIDYRGRSDVSGELQRFINRVPNSSKIVFRSRGVYRLDNGIVLLNRRNLVFDGNGATLRARGSGGRPMDSVFALMSGDRGITIRDFKLVGNNPHAGTALAFHAGAEQLHGFYLGGARDVLIEDVSIRDFYGDCVYIGTNNGTTWSRDITFQDSSCTRTGRHGVGLIAGRDILIQRVRFDKIAFMVVDIEPDRASEGVVGAVIRRNRVGSYGLTNRYVGWFVAAYAGARGAPVRNVTIKGNRVSGVARTGYEGVARALNIVIDGRIGPRTNWRILSNKGTRSVSGAYGSPIVVWNANGLTITGNHQPIARAGRRIAQIVSSSNVVNRNNRT